MKLELDGEGLRALSAEILAQLKGTGSVRPYSEEEDREKPGGWDSLEPIQREQSPAFSHRTEVRGRGSDSFLTLRRTPGGEMEFLPAAERTSADSRGARTQQLLFSPPETAGPAPSARARSLEAASDYLRRDSRRYDARLEKY